MQAHPDWRKLLPRARDPCTSSRCHAHTHTHTHTRQAGSNYNSCRSQYVLSCRAGARQLLIPSCNLILSPTGSGRRRRGSLAPDALPSLPTPPAGSKQGSAVSMPSRSVWPASLLLRYPSGHAHHIFACSHAGSRHVGDRDAIVGSPSSAAPVARLPAPASARWHGNSRRPGRPSDRQVGASLRGCPPGCRPDPMDATVRQSPTQALESESPRPATIYTPPANGPAETFRALLWSTPGTYTQRQTHGPFSNRPMLMSLTARRRVKWAPVRG